MHDHPKQQSSFRSSGGFEIHNTFAVQGCEDHHLYTANPFDLQAGHLTVCQ
jgi:hypothetical protein